MHVGFLKDIYASQSNGIKSSFLFKMPPSSSDRGKKMLLI